MSTRLNRFTKTPVLLPPPPPEQFIKLGISTELLRCTRVVRRLRDPPTDSMGQKFELFLLSTPDGCDRGNLRGSSPLLYPVVSKDIVRIRPETRGPSKILGRSRSQRESGPVVLRKSFRRPLYFDLVRKEVLTKRSDFSFGSILFSQTVTDVTIYRLSLKGSHRSQMIPSPIEYVGVSREPFPYFLSKIN